MYVINIIQSADIPLHILVAGDLVALRHLASDL